MPAVNPDHLLDQARSLIAPTQAGAPRQADVRRAISASYYAIFHLTMAALADQFVGITKRDTTAYSLAYRSTDHRTLKELCLDLKKTTPPSKLARYLPGGGMGNDFIAYATAVVELQEKRYAADYDPNAKVRLVDAKLAIQAATSAKAKFASLPTDTKLAYLSLLAFGARP